MNYSKLRNDFERAIFDSKLSSNQKLVALALKSHMNNDDGRCFPSLKTLAAECSIGQKTVQRAIDALEDAGFISRKIGSGRGKPTQYTLNVIESDVDNRNKHKGNIANLTPNYSSSNDVNPDDFPQADFDVETPTRKEPDKTQGSVSDVSGNVRRTDHLEVLEPTHRDYSLREIERYGYYFNEHYRKHLDVDGNEVETNPFDF